MTTDANVLYAPPTTELCREAALLRLMTPAQLRRLLRRSRALKALAWAWYCFAVVLLLGSDAVPHGAIVVARRAAGRGRR